MSILKGFFLFLIFFRIYDKSAINRAVLSSKLGRPLELLGDCISEINHPHIEAEHLSTSKAKECGVNYFFLYGMMLKDSVFLHWTK